MTFPDHENSSGDTNPNNVGVRGGSTATQIYISNIDAAGATGATGADRRMSNIVGNRGNLTLRQGTNTVTYIFASNAFEDDGSEVYADNVYSGSGIRSIAVLTPAQGDFNTTDPIRVNYKLTNPDYTFTIDSPMLDGLASIGASQYGSANGTLGFQITQAEGNLYNGVYGTLNDTVDINRAFNSAGALENYTGYIMTAEWGSGSSYPNSLAKVAFTGSQFFITAVDDYDNDFVMQNNNFGTSLVGTFNFPVTLTFVDPLIHKVDWC